MKTRGQTRLSTSTEQLDGETQSHSKSTLEESDSSTPPPRKKRAAVKARKTTSSVRASIAKHSTPVAKFLSLPIDVFMEIAGYLTPPEMISLSRSNKFLRGVLMHRSADHMWFVALCNVPDLPPCPEDLCEPQYAALIYSKYCSTCGAPVARQMDPFLNVRLCNACRDEQITKIDEVDMVEIHKFIPLSQSRTLCLRSDKEEVERAYKKIEKATSGLVAKRKAWIEDRVRVCNARREYAYELEIFLANIAETRLKELEELKSQRREDLKSRLEEAGWEESDWTFPWQIARKWATLVEGPKPLTDRVWQNLYPKMIPYLEKNREFQTERFKSDRRRQRERRMRALLVAMKKQGVLLKVNRAVIRGGTTPSTSNDLEPYYDSDDNLPSEAEDSDGHMVLFAGHREPLKVVISRPFPPMADALALPIVQELLEDDGDANALEDRFEESREEVEQVLWTWGETVEHELVDILKLSVAHDEDGDHKDTEDKEENQESDDPDRLKESKSNAPPVDLGFELPIEYSGFLDSLTPEARILLRADSVFRVADDEQAPLPLYYPELFAILQDRTSGWFGNDFDYCRQNRPKLGYEWDTSQVKGYSDGVKAAKVLLQELGRPDATQFELEALGPRFMCGLCADKWVRTWNEIVQHYAEAFVHARLAEECTESAKDSIIYNNLHVIDPASRLKGKKKPLVVFHSAAEAKLLSSSDSWLLPVLVKCNLCTDLGISFLAIREVMPKHIRAVHGIKAPKAGDRTKVYQNQEHVCIDTHRVKPRVSDSSDESEETDEATTTDRARRHGLAVYWSEWGLKGLATYGD